MLRLDQEDDSVCPKRVGLADVLMRDAVNDRPRIITLHTLDDTTTDVCHRKRLLMIRDRDRHARIVVEVAGLLGGRVGKKCDPVAFQANPQRDTVRAAI